jgi:DNA mismatch repair protein MutS
MISFVASSLADEPGANPEVATSEFATSGAEQAVPTPTGELSRPSPMIAQFLEIKAANPGSLLFYRMGDFYELFFEDAEVASRVLGIVLTRRGRHAGADIAMCGVPVERSDDYLHRLIEAGHRVAICEQVEDPAEAKKRGGKSVVRRAVVRLVTPGTLTEERLLEPRRANLLVGLARRRVSDTGCRYGLASVDVSTGAFSLSEADAGELAAEIGRLDPSEIVCPDSVSDDPDLKALWRETHASVTPLGRGGLEAGAAERRLNEFFRVASLEAFGVFTDLEIAAAGAVLLYLERTQFGRRPNLSPPVAARGGGTLAIDPATRANLELTRTLGGERTGSLLDVIDRTGTAAGARLMAERLAGPLTATSAVRRRQDSVQRLHEDRDLREDLRKRLLATPDMPRALGRLGLDRGGPRDLACLRDGLATLAGLAERLANTPDLPDEIAEAARSLAAVDPALGQTLADALADALPLQRRDGGFVRSGLDPDLDEARDLGHDSRRVIAALQARYAAETGCRTLRIKHNGVLGYFVEVPQPTGEEFLRGPWAKTFFHRQSMAGAMRFSTSELGELQTKIASATDRALALELAHFERLAGLCGAASGAILAAAHALAVLDVAASLADLAADLGWTRPRVTEGLGFRIEGGRHPVVEAALRRDGQPFLPNDCDLGDEAGPGRILLVTGPNMGGKSTFLRQNALVVVLAQMGSFVPARAAEIGIVDRLFSRVGAADDLARGRSTFMVEMIETAAILNGATERSLVILDEIGRGTATFDGLSIAWAAVEHLHDRNRSRALFATPFPRIDGAGRAARPTVQRDAARDRVAGRCRVPARSRTRRGGPQLRATGRAPRRPAAGRGDTRQDHPDGAGTVRPRSSQDGSAGRPAPLRSRGPGGAAGNDRGGA